MNKKISAVLVLMVLAVLCALPFFTGNTTSYRDAVISRADAEEIAGTREMKTDLVSSLYVGDQELLNDVFTGFYFYSLPEGAQSAMTPDFTVKSEYRGVRACLVGGTITDEMIRNNHSISLLFYNDDYYLYSSLKCTTLPVMDIKCSTHGIDENYSEMSFFLYDNRRDTDKRITLSDGIIRKRGGITAEYYPKIPYRIKLQSHSPGHSTRSYVTSLLGMKENNSWILYPGYNDEDRVRNVFSQNLWYDTTSDNNAFGVHTGPEYRYLEVFINEKYMGLYALGYTIDEKSMEITSNDDDEGLFKKVLDTRYDLLEMRDRNEDAVRGYRLITDEGDNTGKISGKWRGLADYFVFLDENKKDSDALLNAIDIDNAIDFALFTDLIQGDDSIYKNFYLARKKDRQGNIKTLYCPWDMDATWGNEYRRPCLNRYDQYGHTTDYNFFMEDTYLEQILVNGDTDIIDRYIERYRELRSDLWSDERILEALDGYEKDIFYSGAYLRDIKRWTVSNHRQEGPFDLSKFKDYVIERLAEFDEYFERLEKVKNEPTLIRRTAAYKHFWESDYVLEIKDRDILEDEEYVSFIESIAPIDIDRITESIRYVIYLRDRDEVLYLPDIGGLGNDYGNGEIVLSKNLHADADYFLFYDDFAYTIFLNGVPCYDSSDIINERLLVSMVYDGYGQKMNTALDYNLQIDDSVREFYDDL
jgi:hypothetical protein